MDLQWINGTDAVPEMATKTNLNFNELSEGVSEDITEVKTYADTVSATAKNEAIAETQTWVKGTFSNSNLLINGDFQVWQRGTSFTNVGGVYTADRWRMANSSYQLVEKVADGTHIIGSANTSAYAYFQYNFESSLNFPVTISFKVNSTYYSKTFTAISTSGITTDDGLILAYFATSTQFNFRIKGGFDGVINWVKGELGSVATPFVPRPYGEELAMCQRYGVNISTYVRLRAVYYTSDYLEFYMPFPTLRANPTVDTSAFITRAYGSSTPITGFSYSFVAVSGGLRIQATKSAHGLTDGNLVLPSAGTFFDAEI
ncbi:MAG TPA: hypothetical protein DIC60_04240 [Lachnospiraceae bacterium]|nr:hypothetical protein [Lachnospiraceae bacterium]